ncbi:acyltransferase family protein [Brucella tritici]|uniref:acyltransferase family protein n=1 Tax=Brucella tritici TaxID=94626 RepID=UPI001591A864|nr:acyltransferase [Brucella tritici]
MTKLTQTRHMLTMAGQDFIRSNEIDGLRGLAAAAVVFYHSILYAGDLASTTLLLPIQDLQSLRDKITKLVLLALNGHSAVMLFFVLSGFVLTLSLNRAGEIDAKAALNFIIRRLLRLYPVLVVVLAMYWIISYVYYLLGWNGFPLPSFENFIRNAVLVQNVWIGPSYTIQLEILAVPFILIFYIIRRKFGISGLLFCIVYALLAINEPALTFHIPEMEHWLIAFVMGIVIAEPGWRSYFSSFSPAAIWGIAFLFLFCRVGVMLVAPSAIVAQVLLCAALVGSICYAQHTGGLRAALRLPFIQHLGRISYSLYLVNVLFLLIIWSLIGKSAIYQHRPVEVGLLVGLVATALSIPVATYLEKHVEQWGIRMGRKFSVSRAPRNDPATHAAP